MITHAGYLFKRSNRPFHHHQNQQGVPFPLDSLEITVATTTTQGTTTSSSGSHGNNADLTPSLNPKPVPVEEAFALCYQNSVFESDSSRSNNSNFMNSNGNNKNIGIIDDVSCDQQQEEQSHQYRTRPLHLPHPDDPTASLTSIFNQAQTISSSSYKHQPEQKTPLAPIFVARPEAISTREAGDNEKASFGSHVVVTPTEEGTTSVQDKPVPSTGLTEELEIEKEDTVKKKQQLAVEQSLNCAAAFFGINIESTFPNNNMPELPKQQQATRSITASPTSTSENDSLKNVATNEVPAPTRASTNKEIIPTPTKSAPLKIQGTSMKDTSVNSFDPQAVHRRSSAPCVYDSPSRSAAGSDINKGDGYGKLNNSTSSNTEPAYGLSRSQPADYVDAKDQHLWRAKYCILEEGVLYFYRTKDEAESQEAKQERKSTLADFGGDNSSTNNPANSSSSNNNNTQRQLADLSKSPMASRTCLLLPGVDGGSPSSGSNSNSRTDAEPSFIWEKRVALNCVGAVRSAETEYGKNAFELLAVDDMEGEDGQPNKLVLKAPKQEEMNEWIFQFHRSLASFVMNMVDLVGGVSAPSYALGDIHHPAFNQNGAGGLSNVLHTPVRSYNMTAVSPRFVRNKPSLSAQSLSHGHGRSQMRRRQPGINQTLSSGGSVHSVPSTPANRSPTELQFPLSNTSAAPASLANAATALNLVTPLKHGGLHVPESVPARSQKERPNELEGTAPEFSEPELSAPVSANPETERPPAPPISTGGKYVPPHLRNKGGKYVPPHLRKKGNDAAVSAARKPAVKYLPPHLRDAANQQIPENVGGLNSIMLPRTMSPTPNTEQSEPSLVPEAPKEAEPTKEACFRLGGCADPLAIAGSILDQLYVGKKASRVGQVNTGAHGSLGGRKDSKIGGEKGIPGNDGTSLSLEWEIGAVSECGVRDSNEDAYFVTNDLVRFFSGLFPDASAPTYWDGDSDHNSGLFAIFDGHCGNQAARFSAERLPHFIYEESRANDGAIDPALTQEILRQAIEKMDKEFCRVCVEGGREWESGSTALVAMLANEHLVIASIGDCTCLAKGNFARQWILLLIS